MRIFAIVAGACGVAVGLWVAPFLISVSPWLAVGIVVLLLGGTTWFKVQRRERELDREATNRSFPHVPRE